MRTEFTELEGFAKRLYSIATEEEYQALQSELMLNPYLGKLIPGLGGARKVRMGIGSTGKRGGARVVYYFLVESRILFLDIYPKSEKADLDTKDKQRILKIVEIMKGNYGSA